MPGYPTGKICFSGGDSTGNVNDGDHIFVRTYVNGAITPKEFYISVIG